MPKPFSIFLFLSPILTIGAWFLIAATLAPPQPLSLAWKIGLSLLFGVVPAALIALFWTMARGLFLPKPQLELQNGEVLVGHAAANHRVGMEMRGGRIFATSHALHFLPHRFNVQQDAASMPWDQVRLVDLIQTPMGSKLTLHNAATQMDINLNAKSLTPQDFRAVAACRGQNRLTALRALRFAAPAPDQKVMRA
ncbi:MAG: hypothetical protein ACI9VR_000958 [Cognaticolwellia sp.]|jgi:hypothetical protein